MLRSLLCNEKPVENVPPSTVVFGDLSDWSLRTLGPSSSSAQKQLQILSWALLKSCQPYFLESWVIVFLGNSFKNSWLLLNADREVPQTCVNISCRGQLATLGHALQTSLAHCISASARFSECHRPLRPPLFSWYTGFPPWLDTRTHVENCQLPSQPHPIPWGSEVSKV